MQPHGAYVVTGDPLSPQMAALPAEYMQARIVGCRPAQWRWRHGRAGGQGTGLAVPPPAARSPAPAALHTAPEPALPQPHPAAGHAGHANGHDDGAHGAHAARDGHGADAAGRSRRRGAAGAPLRRRAHAHCKAHSCSMGVGPCAGCCDSACASPHRRCPAPALSPCRSRRCCWTQRAAAAPPTSSSRRASATSEGASGLPAGPADCLAGVKHAWEAYERPWGCCRRRRAASPTPPTRRQVARRLLPLRLALHLRARRARAALRAARDRGPAGGAAEDAGGGGRRPRRRRRRAARAATRRRRRRRRQRRPWRAPDLLQDAAVHQVHAAGQLPQGARVLEGRAEVPWGMACTVTRCCSCGRLV